MLGHSLRDHGRMALIIVLVVVLWPASIHAATVTITSEPSGATVEVDGVDVGKTPYKMNVPGGYLHKPHTVLGARLGHQMRLRLSLPGYLSKELDLANGPMEVRNLNGVYFGQYWLLKTDTFNLTLEKAEEILTGNIQTASASLPLPSGRELTPEEIVRVATPAVLRLESSAGVGTGFLITQTGVAVTNRHVAEGRQSLTARLSNGTSVTATVVYIDAVLDVALLKLQGNTFPCLPLASLSSVRPGSTVLAIGNPAQGLPNTVTKGIVSAIGRNPIDSNDPGTWIQTDAAMNPGNSGGPLLNISGEVVGINTQRPSWSGEKTPRPLQGIGLALSSNDLLRLLRRYYPSDSESPAPVETSSPQKRATYVSAEQPGGVANSPNALAVSESARQEATLDITSIPDGAEVSIDGNFIGSTPSTITVPSGEHEIVISKKGFRDWTRKIKVSNGKIRVAAELDPSR